MRGFEADAQHAADGKSATGWRTSILFGLTEMLVDVLN